MPDLSFARLDIALGRDECVLADSRCGVLARAPLPPGAGESALLQQVGSLVAAARPRRRRARVIVNDGLARYWTAEPPAGAARMQDLEAAARMRFEAVFDEPADDWEVRALASARHRFVCCALRRPLVEGLTHALRAEGVGLVALMPELPALWQHWSRALHGDAWLLVADPAMCRLVIGRGGAPAGVRQLPAGASDGLEAMGAAVAMEAERLGLALPGTLAWCGHVRDAGASARLGPTEWRHLGPVASAAGLCGAAP